MKEIDEALDGLADAVGRMLPNIDSLSRSDLARIVLTYDQLIRHNFVPLLAHAWTRCTSERARQVCRTNLADEINEDHPCMLTRFVQPAYEFAGLLDVQNSLKQGRQQIVLMYDCATHYRSSAWRGVAMLAALERVSQVFIPWLERAMCKLGGSDLEYTQKHGQADIKHALEFAEALKAELAADAEDWLGPLPTMVEDSMSLVRDLLTIIFTAHQQPA